MPTDPWRAQMPTARMALDSRRDQCGTHCLHSIDYDMPWCCGCNQRFTLPSPVAHATFNYRMGAVHTPPGPFWTGRIPPWGS